MMKAFEKIKQMDTIHGIPNVEHTPNKLATLTDLTPEAAKAVSKALKSLIADACAFYVKTKNFHWHLAGPHFREYHLLFAELADRLLASIDPLAEQVRRIGGLNVVSNRWMRTEREQLQIPPRSKITRISSRSTNGFFLIQLGDICQ